jgi:hypothetical protein
MSFKIELKNNIQEAFNTFDQLKRGEVAKAARRAINRTLVTLRKDSVQIIKKDLRIQSSLLKSKYIFIDKARGKGLSDLSGSVVYQSRGLQLIDFIRGTKAPTPMKGIPVKRRKKVRAEVTPGKRFVVTGGFVSMTASKGLQIMKRDKKTKGHLLMQTAPSLGSLLLNEKKKIGATLQGRGAEVFQKNFISELNYRLESMLSKVNNVKPK